METIKLELSKAQYKRYKAFCVADAAVKAIKRGLKEAEEAKMGKRKLKTLDELLCEVWSI